MRVRGEVERLLRCRKQKKQEKQEKKTRKTRRKTRRISLTRYTRRSPMAERAELLGVDFYLSSVQTRHMQIEVLATCRDFYLELRRGTSRTQRLHALYVVFTRYSCALWETLSSVFLPFSLLSFPSSSIIIRKCMRHHLPTEDFFFFYSFDQIQVCRYFQSSYSLVQLLCSLELTGEGK